jgi:hypothetical protein
MLTATQARSTVPVISTIGSEYVVLRTIDFEEIAEELESNHPSFLARLENDFSGPVEDWREVQKSLSE